MRWGGAYSNCDIVKARTAAPKVLVGGVLEHADARPLVRIARSIAGSG